MAEQPPLFIGKRLPLLELSSHDFEDFVYQALIILGKEKNFEMQSGRQPSGDGGFDAIARTTETYETICIQCKRYKKALDSATVADEIIKVALDCKAKNFKTVKHYIITASTVSKNVRDYLKQDRYPSLIAECEKLIHKGNYCTQISDLKMDGAGALRIVSEYVNALNNLVIWSAVDFENELTVIWSQMDGVINKYFKVHTAIKEYPRPDFEVTKYINDKREADRVLVPLFLQNGTTPDNLILNKEIFLKFGIYSYESLASSLFTNDKLIIVTSPGGGGKSELLKYLSNKIMDMQSEYEVIPVRITLRSYSRNSLEQLIKHELGITFGSWKNLPYKFVFLLDGLDEMRSDDVQAFIDEMKPLMRNQSIVVSLRDTGLEIPSTIDNECIVLKIRELSFRDILNIIKLSFNSEKATILNQYLMNLLHKDGVQLLKLPFGVVKLIEVYAATDRVPETIQSLLDEYLASRLKKDKAKNVNSNSTLNRLSDQFIRELLSAVCFEFRIVRRLTAFPEALYPEILGSSLKTLGEGSLISKLGLTDLEKAAIHFDLIRLGDDNLYSTDHDLIADFLSAPLIAKHWRNPTIFQSINSRADACFFASDYIDKDELQSFVESLFLVNMLLAVKIVLSINRQELIGIVEAKLLVSEQSDLVLERANAIFGLAMLGTEASLERLNSPVKLKDGHHLQQRYRAMSICGNTNLLRKDLEINEHFAVATTKFSGGTYDFWLAAPPLITTSLARKRLAKWSPEHDIPICISLETLSDFGDDSDLGDLKRVIYGTNSGANFTRALSALKSINSEEFFVTLRTTSALAGQNGYLSRKISSDLGVEVDAIREWEYVISIAKALTVERYFSSSQIPKIERIFSVLKVQKLPENSESVLFSIYKDGALPRDCFLTHLICQLAIDKKFDLFKLEAIRVLELGLISDLMFSLNYIKQNLTQFDVGQILHLLTDCFEKIIDMDDVDGIKLSLAEIFIKLSMPHLAKEIVIKIIKDSVLDKDIFSRDYIDDHFWDMRFATDTIMDLLLLTPHNVDEEYIVNYVILRFDTNNKKFPELLDFISVEKMIECIGKISDLRIKIPVMSLFASKNKESVTEDEVIEKMVHMLNHQYFFPHLIKLSTIYWSESFANKFLTFFFENNWNYACLQLIQQYIESFSQLITKDQIGRIDGHHLNGELLRIYKLWSEIAIQK